MASSGACLVSPAPAGPGQYVVVAVGVVPDEAGEQAADFGDGERDQLAGRCRCPPFAPAAARVTVRKAWASIARVMCRYQLS